MSAVANEWMNEWKFYTRFHLEKPTQSQRLNKMTSSETHKNKLWWKTDHKDVNYTQEFMDYDL